MREVVVAGAVRTPIGKFGGALASLTAAELGAATAREALSRAGLEPRQVDEAVFGCARQAGVGPNVARQVAWRAGLPQEVPAFTVNMACGSSLKAIDLAYRAVRDGDAEVVLAGGTESMSRVPYLLTGARWGYRMGDQAAVDGMYQDGFLDPICGMVMGETAEKLADLYSISREEQDAFALESQRKAGEAIRSKRLEPEIVPVEIAGKKGETRTIAADEHPRPDTTLAEMAKLPPVFRKDGTVHAGNASGITDGAASLVLAAESVVKERGWTPQAWLGESVTVGVDPSIMGIGPVPATKQLLAKTGRALSDYELIELNEAFAAQVIACDRDLALDKAKLNVNGGAIALGHPIGATGARIVTTLLHEMGRRSARLGLATLCVSGGLGLAVEFIRDGKEGRA